MSILGGIIGAGGALASGIGQAVQAQKNREFVAAQNQIQRDREDTSIQRRVADLKAAGLSPVLAAGQGASSAAPQLSEQPKNAGQVIGESLSAVLPAIQQAMNISQTAAQANLIKNKSDLQAEMNRTMMDPFKDPRTGEPYRSHLQFREMTRTAQEYHNMGSAEAQREYLWRTLQKRVEANEITTAQARAQYEAYTAIDPSGRGLLDIVLNVMRAVPK